jgi:hypothetical protein
MEILMTYPTPAAVALAIAVMFKRSGKPRARLTEKTFRLVSRRKERLHDSFITRVRVELEWRGIIFYQLTRGGFGILPAAALDGAPAIKAAEFLKPELKAIRKGQIDEDTLAEELGFPDDVEEDSDD